MSPAGIKHTDGGCLILVSFVSSELLVANEMYAWSTPLKITSLFITVHSLKNANSMLIIAY